MKNNSGLANYLLYCITDAMFLVSVGCIFINFICDSICLFWQFQKNEDNPKFLDIYWQRLHWSGSAVFAVLSAILLALYSLRMTSLFKF